MVAVLAPTESLQKVHGRGLLLSVLETESILTKIKVFEDGCFSLETGDWNSYWQPVYQLGQLEVDDRLEALYFAWREYLRSGFSALLRQEFCFRYFSLLDLILSICGESYINQAWINALWVVLGFECFGIAPATNDDEVLGAGTCTLRNPCYLLAKLKMPDMLDDPQFLPIITVTGIEKPKLFYHYRQYTLSLDSPASLMFYPAVSEDKRSASFRLINSLAGGVSCGIDPRTRERAKRLCQGIFYPIIQASKLGKSGNIFLEFVDVGAGSGSLSAAISRQIQEMGKSTGFSPKFRLWFVDLEPADPARFFRDKKIRGNVDSLSFLGEDYRNWLSQSQPLPVTNGLRIALVSKLFNNLSNFDICDFDTDKSSPLFKNMKLSPTPSSYLPSRCLSPTSKGAGALVISNARIASHNGRTFAQASLSDYYRGMYIISRLKGSAETPEEGTFLPVRSFNPECLVTSDGRSVISCLVENCDYLIVEDADLSQQNIIDHMTKFSLQSIIVQDMSKVLRLTGNHAYLFWSKTESGERREFSGERIW
jgi:hypothetical protein